MSRFNDPAVIDRARQLGGRKKRALRELKREDAQDRNWKTPYDRRASYRRQLDQLTGLDENPQPALRQKRRRRKPKVASA